MTILVFSALTFWTDQRAIALYQALINDNVIPEGQQILEQLSHLRLERVLVSTGFVTLCIALNALLLRYQREYLREHNQTVKRRIHDHATERLTSKEYYAGLFGNSSLGVLVADREGHIAFINSSMQDMLHLPASVNIENLNWMTSLPFANSSLSELVKLHLENNTALTTDEVLTLADDLIVHWRLHLTPQFQGGRPINKLLIFVEDITELQQEQEQLYKKQAQLQGVLENVPVMLEAFDKEGQLVFWNAESERVTGYSKSTMLKNPQALEKLYPEDSYRRYVKYTLTNNFDKTFDEHSFTLQASDGTTRTINWFKLSSRSPVVDWDCWAMGIDITQQKRVEEALRKAHQQLRAVFDTIPAGVSVVDTELNIIDLSDTLLKIYGLPDRQSVIGRKCHEVYYQSAIKCSQCTVAQVLETGKAVTRITMPDESANIGGTFKIYTSPIKDEYGKIWGAVECIMDVTDLKQAEDTYQQFSKRVQALHEIDQAILGAQSPEAIVQAALSHLRRLIACQRAMVLDINKTGEARVLGVEVSGDTDLKITKGGQIGILNPKALREGWIQGSKDLAEEQNLSLIQQTLYEEGVRSYLILPLLVQQQLVGTLNLESDRPNFFTPEHVDIASEVATSLAIALRQARLHEQTRYDAATKAALLDEVNHRVKNNLASIIGLVYAEQRYIPENLPQYEFYMAMTNRLINRIKRLATVHNMLSATEWSPLPLSELISQVVYTSLEILPRNQRAEVDIYPSPSQCEKGKTKPLPPLESLHTAQDNEIDGSVPVCVLVDSKQASSLALILYELVTNTIKYSGPENGTEATSLSQAGKPNGLELPTKTIHITIKTTMKDKKICLEYRDDGDGYPEDVLHLKRYNVGLYLIQRLVRSNLRGTFKLSNEHGAITVLYFDQGENIKP